MSKSDKTEQATPKKKRDSRKKGQIAKSQDLSGWASLVAALYLLPWTLVRVAEVVSGSLHGLRAADSTNADATVSLLGTTLRDTFLAVAPLMAVGTMVTLVASMSQVGVLVTLKPLVPDFKRINPKSGFQRLFSMRSAWETVKQTLKVVVVVGVAWPRASELVDTLTTNGRLELAQSLPAAGSAILAIARTVAWTVLLLSLADYAYQRYQHKRDLKMTKQEVRDEFKNTEGDGSVKARMRSMARSMARNRMIADVADADVVITNPTHISVALAYDPARGGAPRVLAVGAGSLAARIRERASEAAVPIVEAKPLARALWRACDVGDEVPILLYEAVAKVLVFVRQLDQSLSIRTRPVDLPRPSQVDEEFLASIPRKRRRIA